ncbi:MAG: 30S ribosomal protein S12 methylthiotransferase RimO [Victivallaceae bacterium]
MNKKKKNQAHRGNIYIVSLGCPKNFVDTEVMAGTLLSDGWGLTFTKEDADVFLINTCAFIPSARDESREVLEEAIFWKESEPETRKIIVSGCLVQWDKLENLREEFPPVTLWIGVDQVPHIAKILNKMEDDSGESDKLFLCQSSPEYLYDENTPRLKLTLPHLAYLKIAEGCSNRCSYCSIPNIRGSLRSRSVASIKKEAENLLESGAKELILIAQDTTAFGAENSSGENLPALLQELDKIGGDFWLRMLYTHPAHFTDKLIEVMAGSKHILPYTDIPLQHISDNILKRMGRKVTSAQIRNLLEKIRTGIPGMALRTTFITGFPGETKADFQELKDFITEQEFQRLGVFSYSPEPGTPAASFTEQVPQKLAEQRANSLMKIQAKISLKNNQRLVGKVFDVIIDAVDNDFAVGRTYMDAPEIDNNVIILNASHVKAGDFQQVTIIEADEFDLTAELVRKKHK